VDLAKEPPRPFEAKKLEVSLKIFEGGRLQDLDPRIAGDQAEEDEAAGTPEADVEADEEPAAITKRPAPPSPSKDGGRRPAGEVHHRITPPGSNGMHAGRWLCKACVGLRRQCVPDATRRSEGGGARSEEEGPRGGLQPLVGNGDRLRVSAIMSSMNDRELSRSTR